MALMTAEEIDTRAIHPVTVRNAFDRLGTLIRGFPFLNAAHGLPTTTLYLAGVWLTSNLLPAAGGEMAILFASLPMCEQPE